MRSHGKEKHEKIVALTKSECLFESEGKTSGSALASFINYGTVNINGPAVPSASGRHCVIIAVALVFCVPTTLRVIRVKFLIESRLQVKLLSIAFHRFVIWRLSDFNPARHSSERKICHFKSFTDDFAQLSPSSLNLRGMEKTFSAVQSPHLTRHFSLYMKLFRWPISREFLSYEFLKVFVFFLFSPDFNWLTIFFSRCCVFRFSFWITLWQGDERASTPRHTGWRHEELVCQGVGGTRM